MFLEQAEHFVTGLAAQDIFDHRLQGKKPDKRIGRKKPDKRIKTALILICRAVLVPAWNPSNLLSWPPMELLCWQPQTLMITFISKKYFLPLFF